MILQGTRGQGFKGSSEMLKNYKEQILFAGDLGLIEKGKIYLTQPVCTILKEFDTDMHRSITIFHLLTHTSGLLSDPGAYKEPYPIERFSDCINNEKWIEVMLEGNVENKPGKVWSYCSKGFSFLGEIIKRISGQNYTDYILEKIIKPLEMNETFFMVPEELYDRVCNVTEWDKERMEAKEPPFSLSILAGGGLYSTLNDLFKFCQMFLNKGELNNNRILSKKSIEAMTRNHLNNVPQYCWGRNGELQSYGLGLRMIKNEIVTEGSFGHGGAGRSFVVVDPKEELIFVYYIPTTIPWVPESEINTRQIVWSGIL